MDFDCHSLVVNNCITSNNRQYLIAFLVSLMSFFMTLIVVSLIHFEKPGNDPINEMLDDLADISQQNKH